jgi:hypothetical protein
VPYFRRAPPRSGIAMKLGPATTLSACDVANGAPSQTWLIMPGSDAMLLLYDRYKLAKEQLQHSFLLEPQLHVIRRSAVVCIAGEEQLQAWPAFI